MIRKTTLSLLALALTASLFAQVQQQVPAPNRPTPTLRPAFDRSAFRAKFEENGSRTTESYWLNYGLTMDALNGGLGEVNTNYLAWDSLILGEFGSPVSYSAMWVNNIGDVLDVYSDNFQAIDGITWNANNNYTLDSMSILYAYERNHPNPAIVDTLIVQLYTNATAANMPTYYFTGMTASYGSDTLYFKAMKYLYQTNSMNATGVTTLRIPLTAADTAITFLREKFWAPNFAVPAGKLLGCSVTFKPGFSYVLGDTVTSKNAFFFSSIEENGAGTFPLYTYCPGSSSTACDWNASHIVPTDVRYNILPSWNGFFIPAYAYTDPFAFEHHLISYKVTSTNVSVQELSPEVATLGQNIPNPANGETTIRYNLLTSGDVQLDVFDVTGKLVMSFDQGNQAAGNYQIGFNTASMDAGVYFYTLNVNGNKISRRMVITD